MQVGDVIRIDMPENGIWDDKRGKIEAIDDEKGIATVLVNFIPSENKNVRQDFNLKNLASIDSNSIQQLTIQGPIALHQLNSYILELMP